MAFIAGRVDTHQKGLESWVLLLSTCCCPEEHWSELCVGGLVDAVAARAIVPRTGNGNAYSKERRRRRNYSGESKGMCHSFNRTKGAAEASK